MPRPDPLSTAVWFPYWVERERIVAPTQMPASVVRPAQCDLMKLAFEDAPLSFAEPMGRAPMRTATGTQPRRSTKGTRATKVERVQEVGSPPNQDSLRRQSVL